MTTGAELVCVQQSDVSGRLNAEVAAALPSLEALRQHREHLGAEFTDEVLAVVGECRRRLGRRDLYVCVIGETKSGKSTFLNALLGRSILGVAVRECTGTVTLLRAGPRPQYTATLTEGSTEDFRAICPDRHDEFVSGIDDARRQVEQCDRLAESLPREIAGTRAEIADISRSIDQLQNDLADCESADAAKSRALSDAEYLLEHFRNRLRSAEGAVPFCYRQVSRWWKVWVWLPLLFLRRSERPQWRAHLNEVIRFEGERRRVHGVAEEAAAGRRQTAIVRSNIEDQKRELALKKDHLLAKERERENLPARKCGQEERTKTLSEELERHVGERLEKFHEAVRGLTDMNGRGAGIERLEITYPGRQLPTGMVVIDTPGVNTENERNRIRAWEAIKREADGCLVLSDIQQPVSEAIREFVREVRPHVPHLILMLTKVDQALASAAFDGESPEAQVEEARQIGAARFAEDVGRDPSEVLSFAIAAEPALKKRSPWAIEKFSADVRRLMEVLFHERSLIVASRCGAAIRRVMAGIEKAGDEAEGRYQQRIAAMEEQQIADPGPFCEALLESVADRLAVEAAMTAETGQKILAIFTQKAQDEIVEIILGCESWDALKHTGERFGPVWAEVEHEHHTRVRKAMEELLVQALTGAETEVLGALQERYRIVESLGGTAAQATAGKSIVRRLRLDSAATGRPHQRLGEIATAKNWGSAAGAATGAVMGSVVPGIGTLIGGAVGAVIGRMFGPSLDEAKRQCAADVASAIDAASDRNIANIGQGAERMAAQMLAAVSESLRHETEAYGEWIAGVIQEQRQQLAEERLKLGHLRTLRSALGEHDARLQQLHAEAMVQSVSLCGAATPAARACPSGGSQALSR